jgi:predicted GIY-YIG superfamily endonuclease
MAKPWYVYCLATVEEPIQTYVGATIDLDRRLSQHNGEQRGGAKATQRRPAGWYRVCHIEGFESEKQALSFEWHWKHFSRKLSGPPLTRRQNGLDTTILWANEKGFPNLKVNYS